MQWFLITNIIHHNKAHCPSARISCHCPEAFLSSWKQKWCHEVKDKIISKNVINVVPLNAKYTWSIHSTQPLGSSNKRLPGKEGGGGAEHFSLIRHRGPGGGNAGRICIFNWRWGVRGCWDYFWCICLSEDGPLLQAMFSESVKPNMLNLLSNFSLNILAQKWSNLEWY